MLAVLHCREQMQTEENAVNSLDFMVTHGCDS